MQRATDNVQHATDNVADNVQHETDRRQQSTRGAPSSTRATRQRCATNTNMQPAHFNLQPAGIAPLVCGTPTCRDAFSRSRRSRSCIRSPTCTNEVPHSGRMQQRRRAARLHGRAIRPTNPPLPRGVLERVTTLRRWTSCPKRCVAPKGHMTSGPKRRMPKPRERCHHSLPAGHGTSPGRADAHQRQRPRANNEPQPLSCAEVICFEPIFGRLACCFASGLPP